MEILKKTLRFVVSLFFSVVVFFISVIVYQNFFYSGPKMGEPINVYPITIVILVVVLPVTYIFLPKFFSFFEVSRVKKHLLTKEAVYRGVVSFAVAAFLSFIVLFVLYLSYMIPVTNKKDDPSSAVVLAMFFACVLLLMFLANRLNRLFARKGSVLVTTIMLFKEVLLLFFYYLVLNLVIKHLVGWVMFPLIVIAGGGGLNGNLIFWEKVFDLLFFMLFPGSDILALIGILFAYKRTKTRELLRLNFTTWKDLLRG